MTQKKELYIFDFDETLVSDEAVAVITRADGTTEELTSHAYHDYVMKPGESVNLDKFHTVSDNARVFTRTLKRLLEHEDSAFILTARSVGGPIVDFLKSKLGINIPVFTVGTGDTKRDTAPANARRKANVIRQLVKFYEPEYVEFWDDGNHNIAEVKKLDREFKNIKVVTIHVKS